MFKPTNQMRKVLANSNTVAFIHREGIVIRETKTIKLDKNTSSNLEVYHIFPMSISIYLTDYKRESGEYNWGKQVKEFDRLIINDTSLIAHGFERIEVHFNSISTKLDEKGIIVNRVHFYNGDHKWTCTNLPNLVSSPVHIQPDHTENYGSYRANPSLKWYVDNYSYSLGNSVIVYGEIPEEKKEENILQLTTSN